MRIPSSEGLRHNDHPDNPGPVVAEIDKPLLRVLQDHEVIKDGDCFKTSTGTKPIRTNVGRRVREIHAKSHLNRDLVVLRPVRLVPDKTGVAVDRRRRRVQRH